MKTIKSKYFNKERYKEVKKLLKLNPNDIERELKELTTIQKMRLENEKKTTDKP